MAKRKPTKAQTVFLIPRDEENERQPYRIMDEMVRDNHPHLADAAIALAWRKGWKADKDGRLRLGQAKKSSDLDRELHQFDFVILLNFEAWNAANFSEEQMRALIDHELCHCEVQTDEHGQEKLDRPVWRVRGHDVEEFHDIIKRHGCWTEQLERMAKLAMEAEEDRQRLFAKAG